MAYLYIYTHTPLRLFTYVSVFIEGLHVNEFRLDFELPTLIYMSLPFSLQTDFCKTMFHIKYCSQKHVKYHPPLGRGGGGETSTLLSQVKF